MGRLGVFIERTTVASSEEMNALMRLSQVARKMGHRADFLFRPDIFKIPEYDAIFIRALTDPLNAAFVASRMAEMYGVRVIDDPESIVICCDKVNMYRHLIAAAVPVPGTIFVDSGRIDLQRGAELFDLLGSPLVLKAPNSSFSRYVDRANNPEEFVRIGRRFSRRADLIVAQRFVRSEFDWRVGTLGGEPLYVCQYTFPRKEWRIHAYTPQGRSLYGPVRGIPIEKADPRLIEVALQASAAIGEGLYGVDLKQVGDDYVVIEVNDNPTIVAGDEDRKAGELYERLIGFLLRPQTADE